MPEHRCRTETADYRKKCRCRTNFSPAASTLIPMPSNDNIEFDNDKRKGQFKIPTDNRSSTMLNMHICIDADSAQLWTHIKGTVSRNGYIFKGRNILKITFCVCAYGFQDLAKAFYYLIQLLTFYLLLWNYFLIFEMLTETLLRIPFSVIGRCSLVPVTYWLLICHRRLPVCFFSESQGASCKHFQCQIRRFGGFEAGY